MFLCVSVRSCPRTSIRGSWGFSSCYIPCRRAGSEAFICICSCRPSVTTTACESRPVSERQQLKAKVVFVHSCQMQSKTHFQSLLCSPHLQPTPPSLVAQITAAPHHIFHVIYSIECFCWNLLWRGMGLKQEHLASISSFGLSFNQAWEERKRKYTVLQRQHLMDSARFWKC